MSTIVDLISLVNQQATENARLAQAGKELLQEIDRLRARVKELEDAARAREHPAGNQG